MLQYLELRNIFLLSFSPFTVTPLQAGGSLIYEIPAFAGMTKKKAGTIKVGIS